MKTPTKASAPAGGGARTSGGAQKPEERYFRRGLGLRKEVRPVLDTEYGSALVAFMREHGYEMRAGRLRFRLARHFGFCYGVDRAVDYAYESRTKFPDRRIFLIGEIIHNPHVNRRLEEMAVEFIYPDDDGEFDFSVITSEDVVIIPAFGVKLKDFNTLRELNCLLVDTTCGSVLNVWKRVESYARNGFTTVVHGKYRHEETRTTCSQVGRHEGAKYLIVRDMTQAEYVCSYIRRGGDREEFLERFAKSMAPGFDPDRHLGRIGVANQTTMLASESLAIAARIGEAMSDRWGAEALPDRFRSFDTICSATQERQDAVREMMEAPPDLMLVIGGYNSSNTNQLAYLSSQFTKTFHVADADCIDPDAGRITHKKIGSEEILTNAGWLPPGEIEIGLTAGASTPDSKLGEAVERVLREAGYDPAETLA